MTTQSLSLVDEFPDDPEERAAAQYMCRKLDDTIEQLDRDLKPGPLPDNLKRLLEYRFGCTPPPKIKKGQSCLEALKETFSITSKPILEGVPAYRVPWPPERMKSAVCWFEEELNKSWPKEIAFIAEDLPTLHAACLAIEIAPIRSKPVADDPFPASPILVTGPTGTGKELIAKAIHLKSARGHGLQTFGALNCGGLPTELLESELFGHIKGAFTGASQNKSGFVEAYKDGTLFLDEIGDMPSTVQVRLLRFLNDGSFRPVGSNKLSRACPRIISATHVDLEAKVASQAFREDLFYRIRGKRIRLRGLRERPKTAVLALAQRFISDEAQRKETQAPRLTTQAWTAMMHYDWPGNMRELKYVVENIFDTSKTRLIIDLEHLDPEMVKSYREKMSPLIQDVLAAKAQIERGDQYRSVVVLVQALERRFEEQAKREDSRAATLRHTADLLSRLGNNLGIDDKLKIHTETLRATSEVMHVQEFRAEWLTPIKKHADGFNLDICQPLGFWETRLQVAEEQAKVHLRSLQEQANQASSTSALASLAASLVRLAETGAIPQVGKVLSAMEIASEMVQIPPLDKGAQWFVNKMRDLSPEEFKNQLGQYLDAPQSNEAETEQCPSWEDLKKNPVVMENFITKCGGVRKAALKLGVAPETISRERSKQRKSTP